MHFIRFLHVTLAVTLSGLFLANWFYISLTIKENNRTLLAFVLKRSLFADCVFLLPAILLIFSTGSYQVFALKFASTTPWIISAYLFFLFVTGMWLILFFLKSYNYVFMGAHIPKLFTGKKFFHFVNFLVLLSLIFIIHDAIRKTTFIPWGSLLK